MFYTATAAPTDRETATADAPKPRRSRAMTLTRVDRRGRLGKRIAELTSLYLAALGGSPDALSPMKRLKVDEAAQLKALAELARGDYLRDGKGSLDDIVRIERKANAAERALGIVEKTARASRLTVPEYLAARDARRAQSR